MATKKEAEKTEAETATEDAEAAAAAEAEAAKEAAEAAVKADLDAQAERNEEAEKANEKANDPPEAFTLQQQAGHAGTLAEWEESPEGKAFIEQADDAEAVAGEQATDAQTGAAESDKG